MTDEYAWLLWLGIALAFFAFEAASADFTFLMLAGGALGGYSQLALKRALLAAEGIEVGAILLTVVRPLLKRRFTVPINNDIGAAGLVGRSAFVLQPVTRTGGRVKLAGETWSARTGDDTEILPGEEVRVTSLDGATAVVTRSHRGQHADGRNHPADPLA